MTDQPLLVDPTATRHEPRAPADRTLSRSPRVGLVDGMLNKSGMWGQGMLDAAGALLRDDLPDAAFDREMLDPLDPESPERWAAAMGTRYDALVVAVGDCVTCTTRGVRAAVAAEDRGIPAVVLCTEAVLETVRGAAEAYRLPSLPHVTVGASFFGRSREEIAAVARDEIDGLVAALSRNG